MYLNARRITTKLSKKSWPESNKPFMSIPKKTGVPQKPLLDEPSPTINETDRGSAKCQTL